ncbi:MAG: glutamate racemase [candidate division WOR-3 bacterium]
MIVGPIGVFDSGIGGLTVVRELRRLLPDRDVDYLGDVARFPYGTKSAETILRFALDDADFLLRRGAGAIVVACHTASSVALPDLERRLQVPVIGVVEPGAQALIQATRQHRVGVIGTSATIRAGAYEQALRRIKPDIEVVAKATPLLVALAEEGWVDGPLVEEVCRHYLRDFVQEGVDALLLACTHFPLLRPAIGRVVGQGIQVVDSATATAQTVAQIVMSHGTDLKAENKGLTAEGRLRVYLTDLSPGLEAVASRFLGAEVGEVVRVTLSRDEK